MSKVIAKNYPKEKALLIHKLDNIYNRIKNYNCYIAGGSITSIFSKTEINDFDIYFKSKEDLFNCLINEFEGEYIVHVSKKAITFKINDIVVQFIFMNYYEKPEDIFTDFDFTICMGIYDIQKDKFILHEDFLKDIAKKEIVFNPTTAFPLISGLRVKKYIEKGFNINNTELIKIILAINELSIKSYDDIEKHLGGMYGEDIMSEIKKKSKFNLRNVIEQIDNIDFTNLKNERVNAFMSKILNIDEDFERYRTILNYKIPYFEIEKEKTYLYLGKDHYVQIDKEKIKENPKKYKKIRNTIIPRDFIFYKYVHKKDGKYFSFYDSNYEYKIGEIMKPSNYGDGCLYICRKEDLYNSNYSSEREKAILKCKVKRENLSSLDISRSMTTIELEVLDIIDLKDDEEVLF